MPWLLWLGFYSLLFADHLHNSLFKHLPQIILGQRAAFNVLESLLVDHILQDPIWNDLFLCFPVSQPVEFLVPEI